MGEEIEASFGLDCNIPEDRRPVEEHERDLHEKVFGPKFWAGSRVRGRTVGKPGITPGNHFAHFVRRYRQMLFC